MMSDYETLKECKIAYEILLNLLKDCPIISEDDFKTRNELSNTLNILSDFYSNAWELISENIDTHSQLETNSIDKEGHKLIISDLIDYSYLCENCDENYYDFEVITENVWYKNERKENIKLPSSFNLEVEFDKEEKMVYINTDDGSGAKYSCENNNDFNRAIETYCNNYLVDYEEDLEY